MQIQITNPYLLLHVPNKESYPTPSFRLLWLVGESDKLQWFATDGYMMALYDTDKGVEQPDKDIAALEKAAILGLIEGKHEVAAYAPKMLKLLTRANDITLDTETLELTGTVDGVQMRVKPVQEPGVLPDFMAPIGSADTRPIVKFDPRLHMKILRMFEMLFGKATEYVNISTTVKTVHYSSDDSALRVWIARTRA